MKLSFFNKYFLFATNAVQNLLLGCREQDIGINRFVYAIVVVEKKNTASKMCTISKPYFFQLCDVYYQLYIQQGQRLLYNQCGKHTLPFNFH